MYDLWRVADIRSRHVDEGENRQDVSALQMLDLYIIPQHGEA